MGTYDPRIRRIKKIFAKFCPKFLDLYASIYGSFFYTEKHLIIVGYSDRIFESDSILPFQIYDKRKNCNSKLQLDCQQREVGEQDVKIKPKLHPNRMKNITPLRFFAIQRQYCQAGFMVLLIEGLHYLQGKVPYKT
jgi:hypothetical protein